MASLLTTLLLLLQYSGSDDSGPGLGAAIGGLVVFVIIMAIVVVVIASVWKVFVKAGQPGWAAIVPIYNMILMLQIAKRPLWWIVLLFIPFVSFIVAIIVFIDLARTFGKGSGFGIGLAILPFIFFPILGFGDADYQG